MACSSGQACPLSPPGRIIHTVARRLRSVILHAARGVIEKGVCDLRGGPALPAAAPAGWLLSCGLFLLLVAPQAQAATRRGH